LADKVPGKFKAAPGGLLGRPDLAVEGELQQSKAAQAEEAPRLEAQAEQAASSMTSSSVSRLTEPAGRNVDSSRAVPAFSVARAAGLT
jgi:hypothetical protein